MELSELFAFVKHEREDVRKMAIQGLAGFSQNPTDLVAYLAARPADVAAMVDLLTVHNKTLLGDALTTLINLSPHAEVAQLMVTAKVVPRCMRLMEVVTTTGARDAVIVEMLLMLLNNLTATEASAVASIVQAEDDDMRGYYMTKLHDFYATATLARKPAAAPGEDGGDAAKEDGAEEDEEKKKVAAAAAAAASGRDPRKWMINIAVNATRVPTGRAVVMADEGWVETLPEALQEPDANLRRAAAQLVRNCVVDKDNHGKLTAQRVPQLLVERTNAKTETDPETLECMADIVAQMIQSEAGMLAMEEINAKNLLTEALDAMPEGVRTTVQNNILHYMDDVQDVHIMGDEEEV